MDDCGAEDKMRKYVGVGSRLARWAAQRPDSRTRKRKNPGWSGPGFKVYAVLVAGRGFEPLTFGL